MIRIVTRGGAECTSVDNPQALWVDLENPSDAEERSVETSLGIDVPTPAERAAFEESARFYQDNNALFLTANFLGRRDDGPFISGAVTFVLTRGKLVTVRQIRPRAFEIGSGRASARIGQANTAADIMMALLDGGVERLADIIADCTQEVIKISSVVFAEEGPAPNLRASLRALGRIGVIISLAHDSLSSLQRLAAFARHAGKEHGLDDQRLSAFERDAEELERVAEALQTRLGYAQDGALGFISSSQNDVLRTLAIATILFMPPTLISSIFGMNFVTLGWIHEGWGPSASFALMLLTPAALYAVAKWRRWF
jgi:magnesium transporter